MAEQSQVWTSITTRNVKQENNFCELKRLEVGIYVLNFTGENQHRLSPEAIRSINESLDEVAKDKSAYALITTNQGKFFSNGMDVNYLRKTDTEGAKHAGVLANVSKACGGHAVGAGCVFALAHDYRLMTSSSGYTFMNEVDLGLSLTPGNVAALRSKLPIFTFQEMILTGKRYNGINAAAAGIVQSTCPVGSTLLEEGIKKAMEYKGRNWKREVYHALKMEMYKTTVKELENGGLGYARM